MELGKNRVHIRLIKKFSIKAVLLLFVNFWGNGGAEIGFNIRMKILSKRALLCFWMKKKDDFFTVHCQKTRSINENCFCLYCDIVLNETGNCFTLTFCIWNLSKKKKIAFSFFLILILLNWLGSFETGFSSSRSFHFEINVLRYLLVIWEKIVYFKILRLVSLKRN